MAEQPYRDVSPIFGIEVLDSNVPDYRYIVVSSCAPLENSRVQVFVLFEDLSVNYAVKVHNRRTQRAVLVQGEPQIPVLRAGEV